MPIVPVYGNTKEQLQGLPDATQRVQATGLAAGANNLTRLADALGTDADTASAVVVRQQQRENFDQTQRSDAALGDRKRAYAAQVFSQQGVNAKGSTAAAVKWWDENVQDISGGLQNDAQREAFQRMALQQRGVFLDQISRHESGELNASVVDSTKAAIGSSIDDAAGNALDPNQIALSRSKVVRSVAALAQLNGWTPEQTDAAQSEYLTTMHAQVIKAQVEGDHYQAAQAYYDQHKDEIAGAQRASIEHLLEQSTLRGQAQQQTDRIVGSGGSAEDQLAEARKIADPQLRDEVVSRIKARINEQQSLIHQSQEQAASDAWKTVAAGHGVDAIPATTWSTLTGQQQIQLQRFAVVKASGKDAVTNWQTYYQLRQEAVDDPEKFAAENLYKYRGDLANTEFKQMVDLQAKVHTSPEATAQVRTTHQIVSDALVNLGIKPTATSGEDAKKAVAFRQQVDQEIAGIEARTGRKATRDEIQQIADRMQIQVTQASSLWHPYGNPTPAFEAQVPGVPATFIDQIAASLQAAGRPVTVENIQKVYQTAHQKGLLP